RQSAIFLRRYSQNTTTYPNQSNPSRSFYRHEKYIRFLKLLWLWCDGPADLEYYPRTDCFGQSVQTTGHIVPLGKIIARWQSANGESHRHALVNCPLGQ